MPGRRVPVWVVPVAARPRRRVLPANQTVTRQDDAAVEMRGFFAWLRARWWGDPTRTQGFEEDRGSSEVRP